MLQLLRLVVFFCTGSSEDAERMLRLSALFADSLAASSDGINDAREVQRDWLLRRLIDLCLQCNSVLSTDVKVSLGFKTVRDLAEAVPEMLRYLLSGQLLVIHPMERARKMLYSELKSAPLMQIVRQGLICARNYLPITYRIQESLYCNALVDFVVHLLTTTSGILEQFVMEVSVGTVP